MEEILRAYVNINANDWDDHLTAVEIAINSSEQSSSGYTPYYLNSGQEIQLPINLALASFRPASIPAATDLLHRLHQDVELSKKNLLIAQTKQKQQADKHRRDVTYKVGDRVMLKNSDWMKGKRKLFPKYWGPFTVVEVLSPLTIRLELPRSLSKIHDVFHVSKVKLFKDSRNEYPNRIQVNRPPPIIADDHPEYEVEQILGKREVLVSQGKGKRRLAAIQYLVSWKGYSMEESSWEDEANLENAQESIAEYEQMLRDEEDPADDVEI